MKIFISIFLKNITSINLKKLDEELNKKIESKNTTFQIALIELNEKKEFELSRHDIIIPLTDIYDFEEGFDNKIREAYKQHFPKMDGVLLLQNEDESITIPVIGKNYVKEFGYIYNPIYTTDVAEKEFLDVLKLKQKYVIIKDILFNRVELVREDDKIYEFRKKFNFGLYNIDKIKNHKRKKSSKYNTFNSLVDESYVINLERRQDRMVHMELQMKEMEILYKRFDAIDGQKIKGDTILQKGALGAVRSHIGVIKDAIHNNYQKIAVFEDDIIFCDDFDTRLKYYLENLPEDWDIMYLGCHFNACNDPILLKNNVYKIRESYGCFSMILNNQHGLFQKIVDNVTELMPYDDYIKTLQNDLNCYIFIPFFVKSMNTVSDIGDITDSFEYDIVNKHFAKTFNPEPVKPTPPPPPAHKIKIAQQVSEPAPVNSNQYMCEDYLRGNSPFVIYFNGRLIFDSQTTDKSNLRFDRDHFSLYGKVFTYQGMMIKRK
jgi:hypothetical protein